MKNQMKNVQISELLFKKMYAYFVEQQEEYYDDIKSGIEEKADRIFARYEYSKRFSLDDKNRGVNAPVSTDKKG